MKEITDFSLLKTEQNITCVIDDGELVVGKLLECFDAIGNWQFRILTKGGKIRYVSTKEDRLKIYVNE